MLFYLNSKGYVQCTNLFCALRMLFLKGKWYKIILLFFLAIMPLVVGGVGHCNDSVHVHETPPSGSTVASKKSKND